MNELWKRQPNGSTISFFRSAGDLGYSQETNALAEAIGEEIALRGGITVYGAGTFPVRLNREQAPCACCCILTFHQKKTATRFRLLQLVVQSVILV